MYKLIALSFLSLSHYLNSPNARRVQEIEGGEEKLFATKIEFSSNGRGAEGEENH